MNKIKEQLAEEYAFNPENIIRDLYGYPDLTDTMHQAYCTGHEAAEPKWRPINEVFNPPDGYTLKILFDNGEVKDHKDKHLPFAVATHFFNGA